MQQPSRISVATTAGHFFFSPDEIVRLEACSNYTNIYFANKKKILASKVLKEFAALLEPLGFLRTHRTHLINRQHIAFVSSSGMVVMNDQSKAEISRRMKSSVLKALKNAA